MTHFRLVQQFYPSLYGDLFYIRIILLLMSITACREPIPSGQYAGILFERKETETLRRPVSIEAFYQTSQLLNLNLKDLQQNLLEKISIQILSQSKMEITLPSLSPQSFTLKKKKKDPDQPEVTCYSHQSTLQMKVCINENQFRLEAYTAHNVSLYSLSGDLFPTDDPITYEVPENYTLQEAITRALKRNFDSQIELEHVIQVKKTARAAYLNLLPHISLKSALMVASLSPLAVPIAIFDLAPFLLPNRWLLAKKLSLQGKAQSDAFNIIQADIATDLESTAYTYLHHSQALKILEESILKLDDIESYFPPSTNDDTLDRWSAYRHELSLNADQFKLSTQLDRSVLAQILSINNPEGIKKLIIEEPSIPIHNLDQLNYRDVGTLSVARSLEIKQINNLIQAAKYQKNSVLFNWMDHGGDAQYNLGFNLIEQFQVSQSQIAELEIKKNKIQNLIITKSYTETESYNFSIERYKKSKDLMIIRERILKRTFEKLVHCSNENQPSCVNIDSIIKDYQHMIDSQLETEGYLMNFKIHRSRINRILLTGFYDILRPVGQTETENTPQKNFFPSLL